jgi:pentatricopeptide repeat protein
VDFGITFKPLYDRAKLSADSTFLAGMFRYYFRLNEFEHSVVFLDRMRETGISAKSLKFEQEMVAGYLAARDAKNPEINKPWDQMRSYTGHNHWFRAFNRAYKKTWLKTTGWKPRYWPLILK